MADLTPETREETLLAAMSDPDIPLPDPPYTRKEQLLVNAIIAIRSGGGGGGGGGVTSYTYLSDKPKINGVTLSGDQTPAELGLAAADDIPSMTSDLTDDVGYAKSAEMTTALASKADTAAMETALASKVDAETGKVLSTNDYTDAERTKLAGIAEGATANLGTVTGITMNGATKGTSGVVDLGTVLTEHQDISDKVDKVAGKGLSSNDYTTAERTKLEGIEVGAQVNEVSAEEQRSNVTTINALAWLNSVLRAQIDSILNGLDIPVYHDAAGEGAIRIQDAAAGSIKTIRTALAEDTTLYIQVNNSNGMTSATAQTAADGSVSPALALTRGVNMVYVTTDTYAFAQNAQGAFWATGGTYVNDHVNENGVRGWDRWIPQNGIEATVRYPRDGELGGHIDRTISYEELLKMFGMGVEYVQAQDIATAIQAQAEGKKIFVKFDYAPFATEADPVYGPADPTLGQYKVYYIANYYQL